MKGGLGGIRLSGTVRVPLGRNCLRGNKPDRGGGRGWELRTVPSLISHLVRSLDVIPDAHALTALGDDHVALWDPLGIAAPPQ